MVGETWQRNSLRNSCETRGVTRAQLVIYIEQNIRGKWSFTPPEGSSAYNAGLGGPRQGGRAWPPWSP